MYVLVQIVLRVRVSKLKEKNQKEITYTKTLDMHATIALTRNRRRNYRCLHGFLPMPLMTHLFKRSACIPYNEATEKYD